MQLNLLHSMNFHRAAKWRPINFANDNHRLIITLESKMASVGTLFYFHIFSRSQLVHLPHLIMLCLFKIHWDTIDTQFICPTFSNTLLYGSKLIFIHLNSHNVLVFGIFKPCLQRNVLLNLYKIINRSFSVEPQFIDM